MTNEEKHSHYLRFHRFQKSRETYFAPLIFKAIRSQYDHFIHLIKNGQTEHIALNKISSQAISETLKPLYIDAGTIYGAKIRADLQKLKRAHPGTLKSLSWYPLEVKHRLAMGFSEMMRQQMEQYFSIDILNQSEGITQTTRDLITQVFTEAYQLGEGIEDIVKKLENTELSKMRARLIARTETVTAANAGALFVAKSTELSLNKEWLAASDSRVRNDHRNVSGQVVALDGYFNVGGYDMKVPGDHGGKDGKLEVPGKEIINCRCTTLFIPTDEVRPQKITPAAAPVPVKPVFVPQTTIKAAEEYAKKVIGVKYANFKGIDLNIANDINKAVFKIKEVMPAIRTKGIGSAQQANKELKAKVLDAVRKSSNYKDVATRFGTASAERQAVRFSKQTVSSVGGNTVAWSQTKNTVRIPGGEVLDVSEFEGVFINEKYGKSKAVMDAMVKKNQESKWFTESAEDFGYIMSHEIGHEIDKTIKFARLPEFEDIFNREHKLGIQSVINNLSTYGATAGGKASARKVEMIAEAWAEFVTSKSPRPLATEIGELMLKTYHTDYVQGTGTTFNNWRTEIMKIVQQ